MNRKQVMLSIVLLAFLAVDAYALWLYGYVGFVRAVLSSFAGIAAAIDLTIALVMVVVWMNEDAEQHHISALPYLLLTLALGSVGPLAYLIRRAAAEPEREPLHAQLQS